MLGECLGTVDEAGRVCKHGAQQSERLQQGPTTSQGARDRKGRGRSKANQQRGAGAYLEPAALDGVGSGLLAA